MRTRLGFSGKWSLWCSKNLSTHVHIHTLYLQNNQQTVWRINIHNNKPTEISIRIKAEWGEAAEIRAAVSGKQPDGRRKKGLKESVCLPEWCCEAAAWRHQYKFRGQDVVLSGFYFPTLTKYLFLQQGLHVPLLDSYYLGANLDNALKAVIIF